MLLRIYGGEGGIRTPGTVARTPHFECGAIDHSATSPWSRRQLARSMGRYVSNAGGRNKSGGGTIEIAGLIATCRRDQAWPGARADTMLARVRRAAREQSCDPLGRRDRQPAAFAPEMGLIGSQHVAQRRSRDITSRERG